MNFVDQHRFFIRRPFRLLPRLILPFVGGKIIGKRSCLRLFLREEAVRVGLQDEGPAPGRLDGVFIQSIRRQIGNENMPDLSVSETFHGMLPGIPAVEIPHHAHRFRLRRPDGKAHTTAAFLFHIMCPQHFLRVIIRPLMEEVDIVLCQRRRLHKVSLLPVRKFLPAPHARCPGRILESSDPRKTGPSRRYSSAWIAASFVPPGNADEFLCALYDSCQNPSE